MKNLFKRISEITEVLNYKSYISKTSLFQKIRIDSRTGNRIIEICFWLGLITEIKIKKRKYLKKK